MEYFEPFPHWEKILEVLFPVHFFSQSLKPTVKQCRKIMKNDLVYFSQYWKVVFLNFTQACCTDLCFIIQTYDLELLIAEDNSELVSWILSESLNFTMVHVQFWKKKKNDVPQVPLYNFPPFTHICCTYNLASTPY